MRRLTTQEEQRAQHIACDHLVRGCEAAVSELQAAPSGAGAGPQTKERAQEILAQVLSSWRDATGVAASWQQPLRNDLDDWTSDDLLAQVLARRAGDGPAHRQMQSLTLKAQLAGRDQRRAEEGTAGPPIERTAR